MASVKVDSKKFDQSFDNMVNDMVDFSMDSHPAEIDDREWTAKVQRAVQFINRDKAKPVLDQALDVLNSRDMSKVRKLYDKVSDSGDIEFSSLRVFLLNLEDALSTLGNPPTREQTYKNTLASYKSHTDHADKLVGELESKLKRFVGARDVDLVIELRPLESDAGIDSLENPTVNVKMMVRQRDNPDMTVFLGDGRLEVDDVLDFGDSDFFDNEEQSANYLDLVDYLRTGRLKQEGELKLYRQMADAEMMLWRTGKSIPAGKWFASSKSKASGVDVSGEFNEIYTLSVDASVVRQTDPGVYQTVVSTKLVGKKLVKA
jgi:hypothetical protein